MSTTKRNAWKRFNEPDNAREVLAFAVVYFLILVPLWWLVAPGVDLRQAFNYAAIVTSIVTVGAVLRLRQRRRPSPEDPESIWKPGA